LIDNSALESTTDGTVTVIVPTYNRSEKLERAIQSVLDQTYTNVRILVLDNASTDGTKALVERFAAADRRIEYHRHIHNIGMIANFNFGIGKVKTAFFGILTDDDYFLPDFIENAMRAFAQYPDVQMSVLSAPVVTHDGKYLADPLSHWPREGLYQPAESIRVALDGNHPILTMCLFRQSLLAEMQFDKTTDSVSDLPILFSILAKYPFHISKTVGGYFIRHADASGSNFVKIQNVHAICQAYLRVEQLLAENDTIETNVKSIIAAVMKRNVDRLFFSLLLENLTAGNTEAALHVREKILQRSLSVWQSGSLVLSGLSGLMRPQTLAKSLVSIRRGFRRARGRPADP
jgi:glycosyltransferase involved in cell wall biosynthesis